MTGEELAGIGALAVLALMLVGQEEVEAMKREVRVVFDRRGPARRFTVQPVRALPEMPLAVAYHVPDDASDEQTALVIGGAVMRAALLAARPEGEESDG